MGIRTAAAALTAVVVGACSAPSAPPQDRAPLNITLAGETQSGSPTSGERVFLQCASCHSLKAGENRTGPSLHGIIDRPSGAIPAFRYSTAMKSAGLVWNEQTLFEYLAAPQASVPGTTMLYAGLPDPQARADLIAYLRAEAAQP